MSNYIFKYFVGKIYGQSHSKAVGVSKWYMWWFGVRSPLREIIIYSGVYPEISCTVSKLTYHGVS